MRFMIVYPIVRGVVIVASGDVTLQICAQCGGDHAPGPCPEADGPAQIDSLAPAPVPGVVSPMPVAWLAGSMVGEYEVTGLLGQGGMGVVYSGVHPLLGRKVAIKVLHRQAALVGEAAARFLQEARAASKLRHQNIVDVFAFGQMADGHYYQVMEFLEGESLRSVLHARGRADAGAGAHRHRRRAERAGGGAPARHRSPRREARQHLPVRADRDADGERRQGAGLRAGEERVRGRDVDQDAHRDDAGDAGVHVARAVPVRAGGRRARRYVRGGDRAVRDAGRDRRRSSRSRRSI